MKPSMTISNYLDGISPGKVDLECLMHLPPNVRESFAAPIQVQKVNRNQQMPHLESDHQMIPEILVYPQEMGAKALKSFDDLRCTSHAIQEFLRETRLTGEIKPTEVQQFVYPFLNEHKHVLVRSPTGSGKTIAFMAPIFDEILALGRERVKKTRLLVLTDTKDLCEQHYNNARNIERFLSQVNTPLTLGCHIGGVHRERLSREDYQRSFESDVLFMSPGKLLEALQRKWLDLSYLMYLVFDEADEMFWTGKFYQELNELKTALQECRDKDPHYAPCLSMFSATLVPGSDEVRRGYETFFGDEWQNMSLEIGYVEINTFKCTTQRVIKLNAFEQKIRVLEQLLDLDLQADGSYRNDPNKYTRTYDHTTLVFCDTRKQAYFIGAWLTRRGFYVKIHTGKMPSSIRQRNLRMISEHRLPILITTNAAARGLDKPNINHVIMFELPMENWQTYTHRVGRAGRNDEEGRCTVLFDNNLLSKDRRRGAHLLRSLVVFRQKIPRFLFDEYGEILRSLNYEIVGLPPGGASLVPSSTVINTDESCGFLDTDSTPGTGASLDRLPTEPNPSLWQAEEDARQQNWNEMGRPSHLSDTSDDDEAEYRRDMKEELVDDEEEDDGPIWSNSD